MRKSTLLWLVLAAFCGTALFHTSQKVHDEREKLSRLDASIGKEEESLRVLNAEWSYLNQPARLEHLAKTYLTVAPLKGSQFVRAEDIPLRSAVPAVLAAATPAPEKKIAPEKKPALEKKDIAEKKDIIKPRIAAAAPPAPVIKFRKPAAVAVLAKKPAPATAQTATNTRSFSDVMKSLRTGVE